MPINRKMLQDPRECDVCRKPCMFDCLHAVLDATRGALLVCAGCRGAYPTEYPTTEARAQFPRACRHHIAGCAK